MPTTAEEAGGEATDGRSGGAAAAAGGRGIGGGADGGGEGAGGSSALGGGALGDGGGGGSAGAAFRWQQPAWFNEFMCRVWLRARHDVSRRMQRKLVATLRDGAEGMLASVAGEIAVKLDLGHRPPQFHRLRLVGDSPRHVRVEAEVLWVMGGASLELEVASKYVTVPLSVSDITLRGRVLMQTAPHPDPPYLGRCSLCFLRPPDMDFVLRPMRAFDVMEVPLLH